MTSRQIKISLVSAAVIVVVGILLIVSVSFAWLDVSRIPFISDLDMSVITDNNLFVADDDDGKPGEWSMYLDASEFLKNFAPLKPVTYRDGKFYKMIYSETGRTSGVEEVTEGDINVKKPEHMTSAGVESAGDSGYLVAVDFWLMTQGSVAEVFLREPEETEDGQLSQGSFAVGSPVWSDEAVAHLNSGYGSETTLRIGIDYELTDMDGNPTGDKGFFIYEPNADIHPGGEDGYIETIGVDGGEYIPDEKHIIQKASSWGEGNPVRADYVVYKAGKFIQNQKLFTLDGQKMAKVRMWIWVEGQDKDCYALSYADEASILCNIEFGVDSGEPSTGIERRKHEKK